MTARSDRGIRLILTEDEIKAPTLTAELYPKWYALFLVHPGGIIEKVSFADLEWTCGNEAPYRDHAPNPKAIERLAELREVQIDPVFLYVAEAMWTEAAL